MGPVLVDTNLLLLMLVGQAGQSLIAGHKRLGIYDADDFNVLTEMVGGYSEIVSILHILAEVSNLMGLRGMAVGDRIRTPFAEFVENTAELHVTSLSAIRIDRFNFGRLGLTDAAILQACALPDLALTLLTADNDLAIEAEMSGCSVQNFGRWRE